MDSKINTASDIYSFRNYVDSEIITSTILGSDVEFKGSINAKEGIIVEGTVTGSIDSNSIIVIKPSGVVQGDAKSALVILEGSMKGNIDSTSLVHLKHTASLYGNINASDLRIDENSVYVGECVAFSQKKPEQAEDQTIEPRPLTTYEKLMQFKK